MTRSSDIPEAWYRDGAALVRSRHARLGRLIEQAGAMHAAGDDAAAVADAQIAAFYAHALHSGVFASPELDAMLTEIGRRRIGRSPPAAAAPADGGAARPHVIHVATRVQSVGGLYRLVARWIRQDQGRRHSVVLTRQRKPIPPELQAIVSTSGGRLHQLNREIGGLLAWARRLRAIVAQADLVVMHTDNQDVVPILALAERDGRPPVIRIDHADQLFWLGADTADILVCLRRSGLDLARQRRGIATARSRLLPILLEPARRTLSRAEAKQRLGLPADALLVLSVARSVKFQTFAGMTYADAHLEFLREHERARLLVVGAGPRPDWAPAIAASGGRIATAAETPEIGIYHQAADIYVDSFPFCSTTSMIEAGSYGVPVVTRFPYDDASAVLGLDMPGLDGHLSRARSLAEYTRTLDGLARDEALRVEQGERTRASIQALHTGAAWQAALEAVYEAAMARPADPVTPCPFSEPLAEPDVLMPYVIDAPRNDDPYPVIASHLGLLPIRRRLGRWLDVAMVTRMAGDGHHGLLKCWIPEWGLARLAV